MPKFCCTCPKRIVCIRSPHPFVGQRDEEVCDPSSIPNRREGGCALSIVCQQRVPVRAQEYKVGRGCTLASHSSFRDLDAMIKLFCITATLVFTFLAADAAVLPPREPTSTLTCLPAYTCAPGATFCVVPAVCARPTTTSLPIIIKPTPTTVTTTSSTCLPPYTCAPGVTPCIVPAVCARPTTTSSTRSFW